MTIRRTESGWHLYVQEGRPAQFASKTLVGAEKNYAPIEGEVLGKWHCCGTEGDVVVRHSIRVT